MLPHAARSKGKTEPPSRILIVGCGVIGSIYGARLALSGCHITMLARGKRLAELRERGLLLQLHTQGSPIEQAPVQIVDSLADSSRFDYVLLALRAEQAQTALRQIAHIEAPTIVTMINHAEGYSEWETIVGKGRILPAFPGAGGYIRNAVLHYGITKRWVQPTTIGEIGGMRTPRLKKLKQILRKAGFPVACQPDMEAWQKTHLALVCPLACAYYYADQETSGKFPNAPALTLTSQGLRETLRFIHRSGIGITPSRFRLVRSLPLPLLFAILSWLYRTKWAATFVTPHALSAKSEMLYLSDALLAMAEQYGEQLPKFTALRSAKRDNKQEPL